MAPDSTPNYEYPVKDARLTGIVTFTLKVVAVVTSAGILSLIGFLVHASMMLSHLPAIQRAIETTQTQLMDHNARITNNTERNNLQDGLLNIQGTRIDRLESR